jgi:flagellar biosynthesis chaperone FliJ
MRLVIEIVIIVGLAGLALFFFGDNNELDSKLKESEKKIVQYENKIGRLESAIRDSSLVIDSLHEKVDDYEIKLSEKQQELEETEQRYKDKIEQVYEVKLSELIDSTQKIIKVKNDTYVVVTEAFYRKARANEFKLEKLQAKVGIFREQLQIQDSIIDIKDKEIFNLVGQLNNQRHQIALKDSIITEKDIQVDALDREVKRQKLQKGLTLGAVGAGIILLILL